MGKVIVGMTLSLDGYINDRNGSVARLYPDIANLRNTEIIQQVIATTGAVVMGRHAYDMAQGDFIDYEFQTPIFVLTHHPPQQAAQGENENLKFHFVTDGVEVAIEKAKAAAGDKDVTVIGGAETIQQLLNVGLVDELDVDIAPVLFGTGQRLFDNLSVDTIELTQLECLQYRGVTRVRYRVIR